eukprot:1157456-Pelagomonas_calceolata.AAC.6
MAATHAHAAFPGLSCSPAALLSKLQASRGPKCEVRADGMHTSGCHLSQGLGLGLAGSCAAHAAPHHTLLLGVVHAWSERKAAAAAAAAAVPAGARGP